MTLEVLTLSRAMFRWGWKHHLIGITEFDWLMRSVVWHERRLIQCDGKEAFSSYRMAKRIVRRRRSHKVEVDYVIYPCRVCRMFHVGQRIPELTRARRRRLQRLREREHAEMLDA